MNMDNSNHLAVGSQLGDFSVVSVAGEGGFSVVYVAHDRLLERTVAIKEYLPTAVAARGRDLVTVLPRSNTTVHGFQAGLRSFISEARLLAQFSHPAIVEVYRVWEQNGTAYIAMRYLKGETLNHHIRNDRLFSEDELRTIIEPIFDAIELLHSQNIIHRDVSPDNIILTNGQPVLLDLGAARAVVAGITQALTSVLKPGYAPLEQYADDGSLQQGTWTDVYAIAGVLYKLATGVTPVQAIGRVVADPLQSIQRLRGSFSSAFAEAVMAGLAVFPEHRIKTVRELRDGLNWNAASTQLATTTFRKINSRLESGPDARLAAAKSSEFLQPQTESSQPVGSAQVSSDFRTVVLPRPKSFGESSYMQVASTDGRAHGTSGVSPTTARFVAYAGGAGNPDPRDRAPDGPRSCVDTRSVRTHSPHPTDIRASTGDSDATSGALTNRRMYAVLVSIALAAISLSAYRFWLNASNSAASNSGMGQASSTSPVPARAPESLLVENDVTRLPSLAKPLASPIGDVVNVNKNEPLSPSRISSLPAAETEAIGAKSAAPTYSGGTNAQSARASSQGDATVLLPRSSEPVATRAEIVQREVIRRKYALGEKIQLALRTDGAGYAYCFWLDEVKQVIRIHPNRFNRSALVFADKPIELPGTTGFSLVADRLGGNQIVECHVVEIDILSVLPASIAGSDLAALSVRSLDEVRSAFARAVGAGSLLLSARFLVEVDTK